MLISQKMGLRTSVITALALFMSLTLHASDKDSNDARVPEPKKETRAYKTYHYMLNDPSGENNPNNWQEGPSPQACDGTNVLCTISAPEGANGHPDFSEITGNVRDSDQILDKEFKN